MSVFSRVNPSVVPSPSTPVFHVTVTKGSAAAGLVLSGEIDMSTSHRFRDCLLDSIDKCKTGRVVIDFAGVDFIDSSGLNALVVAGNRARVLAVEIALISVPAQVRKVLSITGLDSVFSVNPEVKLRF